MKIKEPRNRAFLKIFVPCFMGIILINLVLTVTSTKNADHAISIVMPALLSSVVIAALLAEHLLRTFEGRKEANS